MYARSIILVLLTTFCSLAIAQEKPSFSVAIDAVYAHLAKEVSYETLTDCLWEFYQHPMDLHNTTREELKQLHILSEQQINNLLEHLATYGKLVSIHELQIISEFDLQIIQLLTPFIQVEEIYPVETDKLLKTFRNIPKCGYWLTRYELVLETPEGYKINKAGAIPYQGSPDKFATRIKWKHPTGWGYGFQAKKYPGEDFIWEPTTERYVFDTWSGYFYMGNKKYLKTFLIGDYQIGYGQGLVVNAGFSIDKSGEAIPVMRTTNVGIKPHTSFTSYGFRGMATTLRWKSLEQTIYYAYNNLDANILQDTRTNTNYITSIRRTGLHRTKHEISKKGQLNEQIIGSTYTYKPNFQQLEIGLNLIYSIYHIPLCLKSKEPAYKFKGRKNYNIGGFYNYLWHNLHFFGECAISRSAGKGGLMGLITSFSSHLDFSALIRHYDANFHNFYGKAFGENSAGNHNEQGIYIGLGTQPIKKLKVNFYYDYFNFPEPTRKIAEPSSGYGWLSRAMYHFSRTNLLLLQYKEKCKSKNLPSSTTASKKKQAKQVAESIHRKCKAQFKQQVNYNITLNSEMQGSSYYFLEEVTYGYVLSQSVTQKLKKLNLTAQITWSDTSYDNRLYIYEKAALYNKSMPSMYHKKVLKTYFLICYRPTANLRIESKYSISWYPTEESIGSGQEKIIGNIRNLISLQVIHKF